MKPLMMLPGEFTKARCVVQSFPEVWNGTVLDVGCRSQDLREVLRSHDVHYIGVDIHPPADIFADLSDGLPFADGKAEAVVALDVLEHTDRIHVALVELFRVASRTVIVSLPNCYELRLRVAHLLGKPISGKYGLPLQPPPDRHRWFFSLNDARKFCHSVSADQGWVVVDEGCMVPPRRAQLKALVARFPNLLSLTYVVQFGRA